MSIKTIKLRNVEDVEMFKMFLDMILSIAEMSKEENEFINHLYSEIS